MSTTTSRTSRAASALKTGVVSGATAILSSVNGLTPHMAGAIDIMVVEQPDGSLRCSPFYVRFGKYTPMRARDRVVRVSVNGDDLPPSVLSMHLGAYGQAYFAAETTEMMSEEEEEGEESYAKGGDDEAAASQPFPSAALPPTSVTRPRRRRRIVIIRKSLVPSPEQLAQLPLRRGSNTIVFRASQAGAELRAYVHLVPWTSRLVISDVDGTITRSDLLGHVLPVVGVDWSQAGIARLFRDVARNGYQMLFLSSRAIAQANATREYLHNLSQGGHKMPEGPVIISPHGLLPSLYREIVVRRPHEFKIAALLDIRALFPEGVNPFYAGFGNRETDEVSYAEAGVPIARIFTINPRGQIQKAGGAAAAFVGLLAASGASVSGGGASGTSGAVVGGGGASGGGARSSSFFGGRFGASFASSSAGGGGAGAESAAADGGDNDDGKDRKSVV